MERYSRVLLNILKVLILIIMEDTHGAFLQVGASYELEGLNPYYNGRYSWRVKTHISLRTK